MVQPFFLNTPQRILDDLIDRVKNTRWPDEITDSGWTYGANLLYMKEIADYWCHTFDWRKVEEEVNSYPNFIMDIDGYKVHFLHIKSKRDNSLPLIITHGWPGSFLEMLKLIPLLARDDSISFDLVIPSVIGFGFSDKGTQRGCNSAFVAELWHKLMNKLGYAKYGAQGGDIGAGISTWLSLKHPENVVGLHLNYISDSYRPFLGQDEKLPEEVLQYQQYASHWSSTEGAYAQQHSSKPMTLSYGLNDSPIGLCAWIIEKFNSWSDSNGHIENTFSKDELLANVTLYWITQTIHSSIRIYNENSQMPLVFGANDFVKVPVAFAKFPKELPTPPRSYIEKGFNIQRWTELETGGHFAAMEQPHLLADEIKIFFSNLTSDNQ